MTPEQKAQYDWMTVGEFNPAQYADPELRKRYNAAAARIERLWDTEG
jgi:hypothetical protein